MTPATKRLIEQLSTIKRDVEQVHVKRTYNKKGKGHAHTEETKRKIAETLMKRKSNHVLVKQIEEMLSKGMSYKAIAFKLNLTERGVESRIYHARRKRK